MGEHEIRYVQPCTSLHDVQYLLHHRAAMDFEHQLYRAKIINQLSLVN